MQPNMWGDLYILSFACNLPKCGETVAKDAIENGGLKN